MQLPLLLVAATGMLPWLLAAAPSGDTCGSMLLQSHQAVDRLRVHEDQFAPQAAGWLGWGRWVAREDLWHMQSLRGESLFARHMPGSCFKEYDCGHTHRFKSEHFDSVETWSNYFSNSFGLGISGGYGGFSGSIDASMGSTTGGSGRVSKRLAYAVKTSQRMCYRLVRDNHCAFNKSNLQPEFLERLEALPKGGDFSSENMEVWKASFIRRFGTHVAMSSSHGALVQSLSSVDARSDLSSDCQDSSLCLKFGWAAPASAAGDASVNLCSKTSSCDNSTSSSKSERSTCIALGGDTALQHKICEASVSEQTIESWLQGGDLQSGSTAYRFSFMPIWEFLTNVDFAYYEAAQTLQKAVEYSNCRINEDPPVQAWEGSACLCVRTCANGGTLDPATCTCKCEGNARHGWTGPDCKDTYGSCQPGVGTGNPGAAARCQVRGKCASWWESKLCKATDNCCATNFGTRCCAFGSSCQCSRDKCSCV